MTRSRLTPDSNGTCVTARFSKRWSSLSIGAFLTAYALELGASNFVIGLLAAVPQFAQAIQLPTIGVVEKASSRRLLTVALTLASRLILLIAGVASLFKPSSLALGIVVVAFLVRYLLGASGGCAFNSWMRDFLPRERRGTLVAKRLLAMTAAGVIAPLVAAILVDNWTRLTGTPTVYAYSTLLGISTVFGILEAYSVSRIPEAPREPASSAASSSFRQFLLPVKDDNFRRLLTFLLVWNFAINLAAPFFTVHMLSRLHISITTIIVLMTLSQIANAAVVQTFGAIADRFSNKHVLEFSAPIFVVCIFAWIFTSADQPHWSMMLLLGAIHILTGVATAGVTLATSNLSMELSPDRQATSYLAMAAVVTALSAGIAPILGGASADILAHYQVAMTIHWQSPTKELEVAALQVTHWDFFFLIATGLGLIALAQIGPIQEEAPTDRVRVSKELLMSAWRGVQTVSSIAGVRALNDLLFALATERSSAKTRGAGRKRKSTSTNNT